MSGGMKRVRAKDAKFAKVGEKTKNWRAWRPWREIILPHGFLALPAVAAQAQVDLPSEEIQVRPIAPPVEVWPYPLWMMVTAGVVAALLLALLVWGLVRWLRSRPAPPPVPPRQRALAALESLRSGIATKEPYPFSIEVSDVLRTFVTEEFQLSAIAQTSPEFLAATADSPRFTKADKALLAVFLEKADLIKFARVHATTTDSEQLLDQALQFVKGGVII